MIQHLSCQKIDFGFVLLNDDMAPAIDHLARQISSQLKLIQARATLSESSAEHYSNIEVRIPHVSLGQYACLEVELKQLRAIVDQIAILYSSISEPMAPSLTTTSGNIFWDLLHIEDQTSIILKNIYKTFREFYFKDIQTRHLCAQALHQKLVYKDNPEEIKMIDQHFQNWGIPEENRIRPHYTLIYRYHMDEIPLQKLIKSIALPPLQNNRVNFHKLGLVEIDFWGNPLKLLYQTSFRKGHKVD